MGSLSASFIARKAYVKGDVIANVPEGAWKIVDDNFTVTVGGECASFAHRCQSFNAVFVGPFVSAVVAYKDVAANEPVYLNLNLVEYHLEQPFRCSCCDTTMVGFEGLSEDERQRLTYLTEPNVRRAAYRDGYLVSSVSDLVDVRDNGEMGLAAFARCAIPKGTVVYKCGGLIVPRATMYTIQVGIDCHVLFGGGSECIAHCCDPNMKVVLSSRMTHETSFDFVACRDVAQGEMLGFNYQSTEWVMQQPFGCLCGSPLCSKTIAGFSLLTEKERKRITPYSTEVMRRMWDAEVSA